MNKPIKAILACVTLSACSSIPGTQTVAMESACTTQVQATGSNLLKRRACPTAEETSDLDSARETAEAFRDDQRARNLKKTPGQG